MTQARPVTACQVCGSRRRCGHRARVIADRGGRPYRGTAEYRRVRLAVLERDGYVCHLAIEGVCAGEADTVDHSPTPYRDLPRDRDGNVPLELALDEDNLKAACAPCNRAQGATHAEEL